MTASHQIPPAADPKANAMWGGRFAAGPDAIMQAINASIGFDKRLYAQDIHGSRAHAAMLAATGILTDSDAEAIGEGLLTVLSEIEAGNFPFRVESGGYPPERRGAPERDHRRAGRAAAHGAVAQRSGGGRFPAVGARPVRCGDHRDRGADAGLSGAGRGGGRLGDAGLYPSADRAAGDLGPSHAGLCRNAGARPRPLCRCAGADERMPAGGGGAGGHVFPDRPAHDRHRAGLRPAHGQFAGFGIRPRFRAGVSWRLAASAPCTCRALPKNW